MARSTTSSARFVSAEESADWNRLVLENPDGGNVLQGAEYAALKEAGGWMARRAMVDGVAISILERRFLGVGSVWYIPKGPGVTTVKQLEAVLGGLRQLADRSGAVLVTIDPELPADDETKAAMRRLGLLPRSHIQANVFTKLLDISAPLSEVLAALPQKSRYAINRARRDGVTTTAVAASDENCKTMFDLMVETAGGRYKIYGYDYYKSYWQRYEAAGIGQLFFAYQDGRVVAGAYVLAFGKKGTYKDGGSVRDKSAYGASHLLQWTAVEWLKERRVTIHDLCGAPPARESKNPDHRLYGVGLFKASFSPDTTEYVGTYDMVIRPIRGAFWHRYGERLVTALFRRYLHKTYF